MMQNFIDLEGASGVTYRFQRVEDLSKLPAIAGNFVYVHGDGPKPTIVCCGADETLLRAANRWPAAQQSHGAKAIYVRKNVSWKVRATEHEDIVERYRPPLVAAAEFDRQP
jgi:hypothetical protein